MVNETVKAYGDLIIHQYQVEPFRSDIENSVRGIVESVGFDELQHLYDIDNAPSFALDNIGAWNNIDRFYSGGSLDDDDFRVLIKLKIAQNRSNHSLSDITSVIEGAFGTSIRVLDSDAMKMVYLIESGGAELFLVALEKKAVPKPMGVGVGVITVPNPFKLFGFYTGSTNTVGFSDGDNLKEGQFLNGEDIIDA